MTARRIRRPRSIAISVEVLRELDAHFASIDSVLLGMGWTRGTVSPLRRRRDGQLSGRVVWRKGSNTTVWCRSFGESPRL